MMRHPISSCVLAALLFQALSHADAQQLGRLFMTPAKRAELDRVRQGGALNSPEADSTVQQSAENLRIDGYVQRNGSGKSTVWINSQSQNEKERGQSAAVLSGTGGASSVAVQLPSGRSVRLKAGQSIDIATGQVREGYESGLIVSDIPPATVPRGKR